MNLIKLFWLLYLIIILFFRFSPAGKTVILIFTLFLTIITIIRHLNSRNEWRDIAEEYHADLENEQK